MVTMAAGDQTDDMKVAPVSMGTLKNHSIANVCCAQCKLLAVQDVKILPPSHQDPDQRQECEWGDDMRESFAFVASSPSLLPNWIQDRMESSDWSKGKLYCRSCHLHIGSFNFTNEMKCLHCRQTFGSSIYFLCGNVNIIYCDATSSGMSNVTASPLHSKKHHTFPSSFSQASVRTASLPLSLPSSTSNNSSHTSSHSKHKSKQQPNPVYVNPSMSPLHDPFHPESPSISTLDLATSDAETFDQNYDRICAELSLMRDPLHPDNLRISSENDPMLRNVHSSPSSPNNLALLSGIRGVDASSVASSASSDDSNELLLYSTTTQFDTAQLASPEFSSIRSCFPSVSASIGNHQRRHSLTSANSSLVNHRSFPQIPPDSTITASNVNSFEDTSNTFFVSTHQSNVNSSRGNRRLRATRNCSANLALTNSASSSPSRRRPLQHPRMRENNLNSEDIVSSSSRTRFANSIIDSPNIAGGDGPHRTSSSVVPNESTLHDLSSSSDEDVYSTELAREYQCPICLEIMFHPVSCKPCHHKFCGICLKTQACESVATTTKCAVCRSYIHHVIVLEELATKLKECFSNVYRRRAKQIFASSSNPTNSNSSSATVGLGANLEALPFPGFHAGKNSYQICCCIAYIHASKHRKKYMAVLQALLYFVVIGLPIFTLIIATVFSQ